ncbi:MAG: metal-dependent transcriptional regulator [Candidatus Heimdallarchaeota archaeon]
MHSPTEGLRVPEQEIMECLFDLSVDASSDDQRIKMGEILNRLGGKIGKTQLTNIVRRKLEKEEYVDYKPYEGMKLTRKGFHAARRIARNHRLAEAMLYEVFDVPFNILHEQACLIEHGISDVLADFIYKKLRTKKTPFGMPIPHGEVKDLGCSDPCLLDIPNGTLVTLTRVSSHFNDTARTLESIGINKVGIELQVEEKSDKGVIVAMNDRRENIPVQLSKILCVRPTKSSDP